MSVWWIAKTNLCPPLRDFCERCTKCSINAVYFSFVYSHFSFKDHCLSYSTTATECLLSQRGVHIEVDFSFSFVPNFVVNQVKAAFHTPSQLHREPRIWDFQEKSKYYFVS